jgi:hypothetical protein
MVDLTKAERDKVTAWLMQEVESNRGLVEQMEKMLPSNAAPVVKHKKQQISACIVVANLLCSIDDG